MRIPPEILNSIVEDIEDEDSLQSLSLVHSGLRETC